MLINKQVIQAMNPCDDSFNNYVQNYGDKDHSLQEFLLLNNITLTDKIWVSVRLMNEQQKQKFAVVCAQSVLDVFEANYPYDNRPRLAIEAAIAYINSPSEQNRIAAKEARYAAAYAANAAYYAAANAAADAAADAADAAYAAYAAANAANAANAAGVYAAANSGIYEDFIFTIIEAILTEEL